jgi:hypothetical protein
MFPVKYELGSYIPEDGTLQPMSIMAEHSDISLTPIWDSGVQPGVHVLLGVRKYIWG